MTRTKQFSFVILAAVLGISVVGLSLHIVTSLSRNAAAQKRAVRFLPLQQWGFGQMYGGKGMMTERCIFHILPNGKTILEIHQTTPGPTTRWGPISTNTYTEKTTLQAQN